LAGVSRGVARCVLATDPFIDASGYAQELGRAVTERGITVLLDHRRERGAVLGIGSRFPAA
jgi:hypothetical protein